MNLRGLAIGALALALAACATKPQPPVALFSHNISASSDRVGVAMTALPKVDTSFPGAGCLLCLATAAIANASLTSYGVELLAGDEVLSTAILDRLLHKAHVLNIKGEAIDYATWNMH